ncbi:MAG: secondary thiamine-phosphate synthase enzyme YjbQ [Candidatus Thermoplasmatota archaeon]|nr:secondary thiamine-phosphate synthase enzyme YjbQ [Candidatus Thermoplasmatota archaeon]
MASYSEYIEVETAGEVEILDLTRELEGVIQRSGLQGGIACIFSRSSTSAITTIEYEPGLLEDLPRALERLFPKDIRYEHEERWHDGNGHSHIRAACIGPSLSVPFLEGRAVLGTWQQVAFVELDNKPRRRKILIQLVGE